MNGEGDGEGDGEPPRAVIPLGYGGPADDGAWAVARFTAPFVAALGAAVAVSSVWTAVRVAVGSGPQPSGLIASDQVVMVVEIVKACAGVGLAVGGVQARRRRGGGRRFCVAFAAVLAASVVAETGVWTWQLDQTNGGMTELLWGRRLRLVDAGRAGAGGVRVGVLPPTGRAGGVRGVRVRHHGTGPASSK